MSNSKNYLKTSDIKTAAFLLSKKISLASVDKSGSKVIFCFKKSSLVKKYLIQYWKGKAEVNARLLFDSLDRLKDVIHRDYEI